MLTWKKSSWSTRPIHRLYLLKDREEQESAAYVGTFAASRYYSRTWLLHQLGVDGTRAQVLSHQLYGRVVDFLRQTEDVKFVMGTFPKNARVFQRYYLDFIRGDPEGDKHHLEETNIMEFEVDRCLDDLHGVAAVGMEVVPYRLGDQAYVLEVLSRSHSPLYLEAHDLKPFDLLLEEVSDIYERVSLRRGRNIFMARKQGRDVGFAIVECGSEDQNVFSLFDCFRIYVVDEAFAEETKAALLRRVLEHYREKNIAHAIAWSDDAAFGKLCPSAKLFYEVYYWVAKADRMKPFLRHLDTLHGTMTVLRRRKKNPSTS